MYQFILVLGQILPLKKILILRFSSIGDIVLTSPVIRCLRKRHPEAVIHFLCKTNFATLLEANPYLDKVYHFEKDLQSILPELKKEGYSHIVDLHKNLRSWRLRLSLGVPASSFYKANVAKWLMVNINKAQKPVEHIVQRYMAAVKGLDVFYDGEGLDYFLPESARFYPADLGLDPNNTFITFAIGAAHATKRIPIKKCIAICDAVAEVCPHAIVLLGGRGEQADGEQIKKSSRAQVINCCGQLSLHRSSDAIRQSALVISPDTGMMHIAAAFRRPIVSVWGNTVPGFGMYPFYPEGVQLNSSVEVLGLSCRPCSKIGFAKCPKGHFRCMEEIDIGEVAAAVKRKI
jgi:ADP-heptose:LPS heptosyltransferase